METVIPINGTLMKVVFPLFGGMREPKMRKNYAVGKGSETIKKHIMLVNVKTKNREIVDGIIKRRFFNLMVRDKKNFGLF